MFHRRSSSNGYFSTVMLVFQGGIAFPECCVFFFKSWIHGYSINEWDESPIITITIWYIITCKKGYINVAYRNVDIFIDLEYTYIIYYHTVCISLCIFALVIHETDRPLPTLGIQVFQNPWRKTSPRLGGCATIDRCEILAPLDEEVVFL